MDALKGINLVVRFLLEIFVLISVGYWGFKTGLGWLLKLFFGIGLPLLIAVVWGMFGSPKASFHLQGFSLLVLEIIVFGSGVAAWVLAKNNVLAWVLALSLIINRVLIFIWRQ